MFKYASSLKSQSSMEETTANVIGASISRMVHDIMQSLFTLRNGFWQDADLSVRLFVWYVTLSVTNLQSQELT